MTAMLRRFFGHERLWRRHALRPRYDVVIIGAGVHGLATAHYLLQRGVGSVALLERGYLGCGNSGRNTAIIRANYRTPEGIAFYREGLRLYERLSGELGFNVMFSQRGHLTLAHSHAALGGLQVRAEHNRLLGVNSQLVGPDRIRRLAPALDVSDRPRLPILGGLYHPPGGIIRHDAVIWAYANNVDRAGGEIHPQTAVTGIRAEMGRVVGVRTARGDVEAGVVVNCTSGWSSIVSRMAGIDLPIVSHPLQACVTEPLKPILDIVVVSANLHVYASQTARGELVLGSEIDPYPSYSLRSTLPTLEAIAAHALELFPCLSHARILRQWTGICDMTPDFSPIIGEAVELRGFFMSVGWGTYGFKAGPIAGMTLAECIATGRVPDLIRPFSPTRFAEHRLIGEKAAAAVSS